jgi:hypothetical protein
MKYIYSHLGLGDHIICNGLYRELISSNEKYTLFVKHNNIETVSFMIRDLDNITIYGVNGDYDVINYIKSNKIDDKSVIIIGFFNFKLAESKEFDDSFYIQHGIPFEKRWSSFKCDRNIESEKMLFKKFGVKENEYVFVHDDKSRYYEIDESYIINKHLPIIRPVIGLTNNSFDYCYLMENSCESHFIDSSFRLIFDSLELRSSNIFFHVNLKNNMIRSKTISQSKLKYIMI